MSLEILTIHPEQQRPRKMLVKSLSETCVRYMRSTTKPRQLAEAPGFALGLGASLAP